MLSSIFFTLEIFRSKFTILSSFSRRKLTTSELHFLLCFLLLVSLSSCHFFFSFCELFFLVFDITQAFSVSASVLHSLFSNLFLRSSRSCWFSKSSSPFRTIPLSSCLVFIFHEGSKMISKTSLRYCKFLKVVQVIRLYFAIWLLIPTSTPACLFAIRGNRKRFWNCSGGEVVLFPYFQIYFQRYLCSPFFSSLECPFPYSQKW